MWAFSSCSEPGATLHCGAWASHLSGFSCCGAWALGSQTSGVAAQRFHCSLACEIFMDQGLNPWPPALADGFLITGSPGKSLSHFS